MESKERIIKKDSEIMQSIREIVTMIVGIRLEVMKASKWLSKQGVELELASNEIEEAIEALSRAETAMGNAHQHLLVSQATMLATIKDAESVES